MLPASVEVKAHRINLLDRKIETLKETVAAEIPVKIHINGKHASTLFASPSQLKELGVGWVLDHGIVKTASDITEVKVEENNIRISCAGEVEARLKTASTAKPFVKSKYRVKAEKILEFVSMLNEEAVVFKATGGTHSAAVFQEEKLIGFAEDVGRHNAVDKAIGAAALRKADFSKCVLASSGRQPANMVLKAAHVGIPVIASIAAPIHSGVETAIKTGVTLICFARSHRMNIYSHPERIET